MSERRPESVFGNWLGSTGHWPVPSGDSPDGTGRASPAHDDGLLVGAAAPACAAEAAMARRRPVPVGGSPTGAGQWPAPPIFQIRSEQALAALPVPRVMLVNREWTRIDANENGPPSALVFPAPCRQNSGNGSRGSATRYSRPFAFIRGFPCWRRSLRVDLGRCSALAPAIPIEQNSRLG